MKKITQIICLLLTAVMAMSILCINVSAASSPKISKSSMIMLVGSSRTLKISGTEDSVAWSSSDTSVCSVSKSGKVKAKSAGTAKICAKAGNKKLYCKVRVVESYISSVSPKTVTKGERAVFSLKSYNVKSVTAYSSDNNIVNVAGVSVSDGKIKIKIEAVSGGTTYINIVDNDNADAFTKVKITVNAPADNSTDTDSGTTSIKIKLVDNGDGTTSIVLVPVDNDTSNSSSSEGYAEEILELVNAERAKEGVPALSLDDELCKAAQVRAKEVGEKFSHTRPDGTECFTILKEYNISCVYAGENIADGPSTSEGAMELWMNSPGHRSNILRSGWCKLGVGYDEATNSWVQIFTD